MTTFLELSRLGGDSVTKISIKRRTGDYTWEDDWQLIEDRDIGIGSISKSSGDSVDTLSYIVNPTVDITIDNADGYFTLQDDARSFWYSSTETYYTHFSKIKIDIAYIDTDGAEVLNTNPQFEGLIDIRETEYIDEFTQKLTCVGYLSILSGFVIGEVVNQGAYTTTSGDSVFQDTPINAKQFLVIMLEFIAEKVGISFLGISVGSNYQIVSYDRYLNAYDFFEDVIKQSVSIALIKNNEIYVTYYNMPILADNTEFATTVGSHTAEGVWLCNEDPSSAVFDFIDETSNGNNLVVSSISSLPIGHNRARVNNNGWVTPTNIDFTNDFTLEICIIKYEDQLSNITHSFEPFFSAGAVASDLTDDKILTIHTTGNRFRVTAMDNKYDFITSALATEKLLTDDELAGTIDTIKKFSMLTLTYDSTNTHLYVYIDGFLVNRYTVEFTSSIALNYFGLSGISSAGLFGTNTLKTAIDQMRWISSRLSTEEIKIEFEKYSGITLDTTNKHTFVNDIVITNVDYGFNKVNSKVVAKNQDQWSTYVSWQAEGAGYINNIKLFTNVFSDSSYSLIDVAVNTNDTQVIVDAINNNAPAVALGFSAEVAVDYIPVLDDPTAYPYRIKIYKSIHIGGSPKITRVGLDSTLFGAGNRVTNWNPRYGENRWLYTFEGYITSEVDEDNSLIDALGIMDLSDSLVNVNDEFKGQLQETLALSKEPRVTCTGIINLGYGELDLHDVVTIEREQLNSRPVFIDGVSTDIVDGMPTWSDGGYTWESKEFFVLSKEIDIDKRKEIITFIEKL